MPEIAPTALTPLSMWILIALGGGDLHGYALIQEIERHSEGEFSPGTGTLYAALQRLLVDRLIVAARRVVLSGAGRGRCHESSPTESQRDIYTAAGRLVDCCAGAPKLVGRERFIRCVLPFDSHQASLVPAFLGARG